MFGALWAIVPAILITIHGTFVRIGYRLTVRQKLTVVPLENSVVCVNIKYMFSI